MALPRQREQTLLNADSRAEQVRSAQARLTDAQTAGGAGFTPTRRHRPILAFALREDGASVVLVGLLAILLK